MSICLSTLHSQFLLPEKSPGSSIASRGKHLGEAGPCWAALCCPLLATTDDQGLLFSSGQCVYGFTPSISQETRWASTLPKQHTTMDAITQGKAPLRRLHPRSSSKKSYQPFIYQTCWVPCAKHMVRLEKQMRRTERKDSQEASSAVCVIIADTVPWAQFQWRRGVSLPEPPKPMGLRSFWKQTSHGMSSNSALYLHVFAPTPHLFFEGIRI